MAFLRGINVGGRKPVKMDALKTAFESLGFSDVRTVLASGNVLFESPETDPSRVAARIRDGLAEIFGGGPGVMVRTAGDINDLAGSDPFRAVKLTPQTRLYVTFLAEEPVGGLQVPYESPEGDLKILEASRSAVFSVVELSEARGTTELMKVLEQKLGRDITTRNWNTILKIRNKMEA
ncbi:MAG: DUF1697 domain-containing protein [Candidatus Geothermincolia bacterium]